MSYRALPTLIAASLLAALPAASIRAQQGQASAEIEFERPTFDFGTVAYGGNGTTEFKFRNLGTMPLVLTQVTSSCSCLVPQWEKSPIMPGGTGFLKVKYDTKRSGAFSKTVTVTSNSARNPSVVLRVKGTVSQPAG